MTKLRASVNAPLILFEWTGEAFVPLPRFARLCDKDFVVGEKYKMEVIEERSIVSHNHFFAEVHDAWLNLPEDTAQGFPTPDHLRKYALIRCGFHDSRTISFETAADARKAASFIEPMDEFAVVTVEGRLVTVYTAKSQSYKAMGKEDFQRSKQAVLEILAGLIGVDKKQLSENAGNAA